MTFRRKRRPDDWTTNHARALAAVSDRLDGVLEPSEAAWLGAHLASCAECRTADDDYATQRVALRGLRDRTIEPPRDLWARTAAAIEHESRFRDAGPAGRRDPLRLLAPYALLSAALVVAVVVGTLTSSQQPGGDGHASPSDISVALGSGSPTKVPGATPMLVGEHVEWISQGADGNYRISSIDVHEVCPDPTTPCDTAAPHQDNPVELTNDPSTVFGSPDHKQLIVVNEAGQSQSASISVVRIAAASAPPTPSASPSETPTPSVTASPVSTPSPTPRSTPTPRTTPPPTPAVPTPTPSETPKSTPVIATPSPSVAISPSSTPGGPVQIAHDVVLVGQSAAYSVDGTWFAFSARPVDGSVGPDIYIWKVGDPEAHAVTTDHRSVFGSWSGDIMIGSSVVETTRTTGKKVETDLDATSFLLDPSTGVQVQLPQTGRTWRPSVDPHGRQAVYWTGSLRRAEDAPMYLPDAGRLVLGDWATGNAAPSEGPLPTELGGDQGSARHETTIAAGQLEDWDARWDETGTRLAVWIADPKDPTVGFLSLYVVDSFDGRIDLKKPVLDAAPATAGFSISGGRLVWAEPGTDASGSGGRILVLAWTDQGSGTIETNPDNVVVIR